MEVDLFATYLNAQLPLYVSPMPDLEAVGVEAMSTPWTWKNMYAFPPWVMIPAVLHKFALETDKTLILVAPLWPSKPWFPELLALLTDYPRQLPQRSDLLTMPINGEPHNNLGMLKLHAWRLSTSLSEVEGFHRALQIKLLREQSETNLPNNTIPVGKHSVIGVVNGMKIQSTPL